MYNKLSWFVSELSGKDISNVYNKLPWFVSELPEKISQTWVGIAFYNKLLWFLYLKKLDISNVVVQCR